VNRSCAAVLAAPPTAAEPEDDEQKHRLAAGSRALAEMKKAKKRD
jgi:hypothetical protein